MFIGLTVYIEDEEVNIELDLFSVEYLELFDRTSLDAGTIIYLKSGRYFHAKEQIHKLRNKIQKAKTKFAYNAMVEYMVEIIKTTNS